MKTVAVLLSTYNGEKYLSELIDSVLCQTGVNVSLFVRDDGSHDNTYSILEQYENAGDLVILEQGENIGYAKSFWRLICLAPEVDYYAFADQDDIWCPDKLFRAVELLDKIEGPRLYTSDVIPVDASLNEVNRDLFPIHGPLSFEESLQRSILPGCTFVFDEQARKVAAEFDGYMESHDWALYAIICAFGTVAFDERPRIKYRLHENNAIGSDTPISVLLAKVKRFFAPSSHVRSRFASAMLNSYDERLNSRNREILELLAHYSSTLFGHIKLAFSSYFSGCVFKLYALLGRI